MQNLNIQNFTKCTWYALTHKISQYLNESLFKFKNLISHKQFIHKSLSDSFHLSERLLVSREWKIYPLES